MQPPPSKHPARPSAAATPVVGRVDFGALRRLSPISRLFGFDRGRCIDRYYIEVFLEAHAQDIRGRVLEVAESTYTRRFGGSRVTHSDVLHLNDPSRATLVADLTRAQPAADDTFDCIIFTQTLQHLYTPAVAIGRLQKMLKPDGVLLATMPGISQISRYDMDRWGDYWRFTTLSAMQLFEQVFESDAVRIDAFGNVLTAVAFLHGLVVEDLRAAELEFHDPDYPLVITVRAQKAGAGR
jgi:SAM-dependent methyltransferase